MANILCRHKDKDTFERLGFGMVLEELDERVVLVEWLLSKRVHKMIKKVLLFLDEE